MKLGIGVPESAPPLPELLGSFFGIFGMHHRIVQILSEFSPELLFPGKVAGVAILKGNSLTKDHKRSPGALLLAAQSVIFPLPLLRRRHKKQRKRPVENLLPLFPGRGFPGSSLLPAPYPCRSPALFSLTGENQREDLHRFGMGQEVTILHFQSIPNSSPVGKGESKGFQRKGSKGNPHDKLLRLREGLQYLKPLVAVKVYLLSHLKTAGGRVLLFHS
jgi:hypothetical protein